MKALAHLIGSRRPRNAGWWILAALLAVVSVYETIAAVHSSRGREATMTAIAHAIARDAAERASHRLELLATQTLRLPANSDQRADRTPLTTLASAQRKRVTCACTPFLPALALFEISGDTLSGLETFSRTVGELPLPSVRRLAQALLAAPRPSVRLVRTDSSLAALLLLPDTAAGEDNRILGALIDLQQTLPKLFENAQGEDARLMDSTKIALLPHSASTTLDVFTNDGLRLLGTARDDSRVQATVTGRDALNGLRVTVAISQRHLGNVTIPAETRTQLWRIFLLFLGTVAAVILAAAASRREERLARSRSDFIAGVSHELRMPLAQLLMASETLSLGRAADDAERNALLTTILREARRLGGLVDNVLMFARSGAKQTPTRQHLVSVAQLFDDVLEATQLVVDDAGQQLEALTPPSAEVLGDRELLRQALVNLVDNAVKYGPQGQTVRLSAEQATHERLRLCISDQGPGLPTKERERIFQPYHRLARDQNSERTGTGLGLAIVRDAVTLCGGTVRIECPPSGGTQVVIELRGSMRPLGLATEESEPT